MFSRRLSRIRRTLGFRLTVWYSTLFILSCAILFSLAFFLVSATIRKYDQESVLAKMDDYALLERTQGAEALKRALQMEKEANLESDFFVRLADSRNRTILLTVSRHWKWLDLNKVESASIPTRGVQRWISVSQDHGGVLEILNRRLSDGSILQIVKKPENRGKLLESFGIIFAGIMIPVVLIGLASGAFLAFRALRPIRDLIQTVKHIDSGKMDARVPSAQTNDELEELVRLFNAMLGRIETLIIGMREALDNVAHDLRTPVTRLRNVIETALQSQCGESALREALLDSAEESERIITVLDTLIDISEAEKGSMSLNLERTDVVALIRDAVELYQYVAEDKGVTLAASLPQALYAQLDANRIRQVMANLVDNAVKFTPAGGRVDIEAAPAKKEVVIVVKDTGIGILQNDLPRIFDRLFRGERSRFHRGLGLGLSMVQAVVRAHQGRIEVESKPDEGSTFRVFLPVVCAPGFGLSS